MNKWIFKPAVTAVVMTIGALLIAGAFNLFLIPHQLLSGGLSGVAMMIGYITGGNIGWLYLLLNVPVLVWGWFIVGRRFIIWSMYTVLASTLFLQLIPVAAIAKDIVLGSVFGGIILGIGTGMTLRYGGSSGGFDIIASIITRKRDLPVGSIIFTLNGLVIAALVLYTQDWNLALYSLLSIYIAGKVVDIIHVRHIKVTAFIITTKTEEMLTKLLSHPRGITIIKTRGAYTSAEQDMLMTVRTRYELAELRKTIASIDNRAFVNIVETVGVIGDFRRSKD
ncbi:YitT family protein [Paenibacillus glycanilyticus]|uniref:Membrane protein n=1 Tax=Paenibacillus glycanilyticus TaxID=126569 RepID=A0ABQ6NKP2_9BACL|nr:YitT family protein [Paenibacillus glycanilyticus]GMK45641.1 membrane protein [Paenibacillus glycanilyticus]